MLEAIREAQAAAAVPSGARTGARPSREPEPEPPAAAAPPQTAPGVESARLADALSRLRESVAPLDAVAKQERVGARAGARTHAEPGASTRARSNRTGPNPRRSPRTGVLARAALDPRLAAPGVSRARALGPRARGPAAARLAAGTGRGAP